MKKLLILISFILSATLGFTQMISSNGLLGQNNSPDVDAVAFFTKMNGLADPVPAFYKILYNNVTKQLKYQKGDDGTTSLWSSHDWSRIEATYSKTAALNNLINSSFTATITNDYGGSFTTGVGLIGNGSNFRVNTAFNPFDGGTYKYTTTSATVYVCIVGYDTGSGGVEIGAMNNLSSQGTFLRLKEVSGNNFRNDAYLNNSFVFGATNSPAQVIAGFNSSQKTASGVQVNRTNGVRIWGRTLATDASVNTAMFEFCFSAAGTPTLFSPRTHAMVGAGSGNINMAKVEGIYMKYWSKPLNNSTSLIRKRLSVVGDSRTNYQGTVAEAGASLTLSRFARYLRTTQGLVGTEWVFTSNGLASTTLTTINTDYTATFAGSACALCDQDVQALWAVYNDMSNSSSITGAIAKSRYDTWIANSQAEGYRTQVIIGEIDRDGNFTGGQNAAGYDIVRDALRTLMLAEYTQSTSVSNVWQKPGTAQYYFDVWASTELRNAADATYFQDVNHLTDAGYDIIATTYLAPFLLTLNGFEEVGVFLIMIMIGTYRHRRKLNERYLGESELKNAA